MKRKIAFYLAGSIQKGHEKAEGFFWTDVEKRILKEKLSTFEVAFLNPAHRNDDLSDQKSVFGRDMLQVFSKDTQYSQDTPMQDLVMENESVQKKISEIATC